MSFEARGMHLHLMCIAWQQQPPCTLPGDDLLLRQWVGNPRNWERLKEQIFRAWKLTDGRWLQAGLLVEFDKQNAYRESRKHGARAMHMQRGCTKDASALLSSSSFAKKPPTPFPIPNEPSAQEANEFDDWQNAQYGRHPNKRDMGLWHTTALKRFSDNLEARKLFETNHKSWCKTQKWREKQGSFAPKLWQWVEDDGWKYPPPGIDADDGPLPPSRPWNEVFRS